MRFCGELLWMVVKFVICAQSKPEDYDVTESQTLLSKALTKVVEELWVKSDCVTMNLLQVSHDERMADLIMQFMRDDLMDFVPVRIEMIENLNYIPARPKRCNIFVAKTSDDFLNNFHRIRPVVFDFFSNFIFVIAGKPENVEKMFQTLWANQIVNVNVLYNSDNSSVIVETYYPFKTAKCATNARAVVDEFKDGSFLRNKKNLFKDKLLNLHRCPIRIATSNNSVPYIFAEKRANGSYSLRGRDIELVNTLGQYLNFKIEYVFVGDEGVLLENGTATGPFKMLLEKKADLIIADYWLKANRLQFIDYTTPYISQQIAFIIPPGSELNSFEKFMRPLDSYVWFLLIIFVGCGFLVIYVVGRLSPELQDFVFGTNVRKPYMNILVAIFGGSQNILPHRNFARSLLMMFLMFCMVMRTLYTGSLFRFLQSKVYNKEAQSIDDMIERDYKFYTVPSILDLLQGQSRISKRSKMFTLWRIDFSITRLFSRLVVFDPKKRNEILGVIKHNPKFKGAMFRSLYGTLYDNQIKFNETKSVICREIFMLFPVVIYVQKDSYLREAINEKIRNLHSAGLIDKWHTDIIDERLLKVEESKEPRGIKIEYLSGCFFTWMASCVFSFLVFLGEAVQWKWQRKNKNLEENDHSKLKVKSSNTK